MSSNGREGKEYNQTYEGPTKIRLCEVCGGTMVDKKIRFCSDRCLSEFETVQNLIADEQEKSLEDYLKEGSDE